MRSVGSVTPPEELLDCTVSERGGRVTLTVRGEIDFSTRPLLCRTLRRVIESGARDVVIDLSGVTFMGAAAVGTLVRTHRALEERGARLRLRGVDPYAVQLLELTGHSHLLVPQPAAEMAVA